MSTTYYPINEEAAHRAKEVNSFSDYTPGSATAEYRRCIEEATAIAERQKKRVDPMYHERIDRLLDLYARKLAENMSHGYEIDARVPSVLIAGPANFPTRKKEKQNAARDKNMEDWQHIQGLLDKIRSTGLGGISADDPNAVEKLERKLKGLEAAQERMKAVNAYYRKHKTLDGCPVLTPEQAKDLTEEMEIPWRTGDKPYLPWMLANNNAEIRRLKGRIIELSSRSGRTYTGWTFCGGTVSPNQEVNRLQILFDQKPDAEVRDELKRSGFKWSPKYGAWQRQLTDNAIRAARCIQAIQPKEGT